MGREFIGECGWGKDPKSDDLDMELAIKYIKQSCGPPPSGVDVEITSEGSEVGNEGEEVSYPVISVVWDDFTTEYPDEYISKCSDAFDRFELSEEDYARGRALLDLNQEIQELFERISEVRLKDRSDRK